MYKLFLTLRYLHKRRIVYFAIAAVVLCTAMVLIVMSVMGGFLDQLKTKARGLLGDIIVDNRSYAGFPLYDEFIDEISAWPEVEVATPVIYSFGLMHFQGTTQTNTVRVVGLRLQDTYAVNAFKQSLYYEHFYPDTTHLGEQRQPLVGIDPDADPIQLEGPEGEIMLAARPVLPPAYQQALEESWAAGIRDEDTPDNEYAEICREAGIPVIVGQYALNEPNDPRAIPGPPAMRGPPYPGLIIGRDIVAERLPSGAYKRFHAFPRGCVATLTLLPVTGTGSVDTPIKQPFRYADDSRTGIYEIDSQHVYCDFDLLQTLLLMGTAERVNAAGETIGTIPARCSQIQVAIREKVDGRPINAKALAERMEQAYHELTERPDLNLTLEDISLIQRIDTMTWEESQIHIIAPVEKERILVTILFAIISLVAAVLVLCILYMIVLQKTRDIGIVKSLGGSSTGLAGVFIMYGVAVGVVGSAIGATGGYFFVIHINDIQSFLTSLNPAWQVWDRSVYSFDEIPNTVRTGDIVTVIIAAICASTLGSLLAAWRAGAMQPVEALRYE